MSDHEFGGQWTRVKLKILESYLQFYTTALHKRFTLHYVDAFAGTGKQSIKKKNRDQLEFEEHAQKVMEGSASISMDCVPPFHKYHFNDLNPQHYETLVALAKKKNRHANISQLDANNFLLKFCNTLTRNDRAVIFLDPYSVQLDWSTLQRISETKKADVWLLFPISALLRMMPNSGHEKSWVPRINRLLGTDEWIDACYQQEEHSIGDLFGSIQDNVTQEVGYRRIDHKGVGQFITERLRGIFPLVEDPVLLTNKGSPLFLFYFCASNDSDAAKKLASKVVRQIKAKLS